MALIALAVKLGLCKRKGALTGQQFMKRMNGDVTSNLIPMGNSRTTTYLPVPNHQHRWVDQQALDLRLMEQQRLFKMMFRNAMRAQQTARVAPMPRAQIFEVPVEQNYPTGPKSCPRPKSSGRNGINYETVKKSSSTKSQESFEIIEVCDDSNRSIPATPGGSPRVAKKATKANLHGGSAAASSSSSLSSSSSSTSSSSSSATSRNSSSSHSGSDKDNNGKKATTVKDPLKGQVPLADKQPALNPNTPKIPKLPKQRSKQGGVEQQMRALLISDEDLDRYTTLH